jgi:GMP synthase (glutamine-hydrolysing)
MLTMSEPLDTVALLHAPHEGLSRLRPALEGVGFRCTERLQDPRPEDARAPLLVVLGGPMGVYEADRYPFLATEVDLLRARLVSGRPSIGLCLGAQLLAAAAGATVRRGEQGKVIGVAPVRRVSAALNEDVVRRVPETFDVVHWHGDVFEPIPGTHLFTADPYPAQGFRIGRSWGFQFHAELGPGDFRSWVEETGPQLRRSGRNPEALLAEGLPRLEAALPVLDRLLETLAAQVRAAVQR